MKSVIGAVLVSVMVACGGSGEAEPVALCAASEALAVEVEAAAARLDLDYSLDCSAAAAREIVIDGRCGARNAASGGQALPELGPDAICVSACTVPGECELSHRIELAMIDAGL